MLKDYSTTAYVLCECAVLPEDISMDIINESTVLSPTTGQPVTSITANSTLQSFDVENWNKRIYGGDLVMTSLDEDGMIQNDIKMGQWMGEFGHPLDTSPRRQVILNPQTVSHRILKYWREGNLLKGTIQTVPYGNGLSMTANAKLGIPWSFSLRSLGSVDMATRRVKSPLKIITYDSVYRPSHIEAYTEKDAFLHESAGEIYLPTSYNMEDILEESTVFEPITEAFDMKELMDYAASKSDNVKIIADMFKLDKVQGTLNESGTGVTLTVDSNTKVNVPLERFIGLQYADILNLGKRHNVK